MNILHQRDYLLALCIISALLVLALPSGAHALTLPQVVGFLHIGVGLILTGVVLLFVTGFSVYVARFNTWPTHRDAAIRVLEWAVVMLFVLVVVLAIVNAVQHHGDIALPILAFLIIVVVGFFIVRYVASAQKKPPPPRR